MEKTAGGHRRLPMDAVVRFIRDHGYTLEQPEVLGLPVSVGQTDWTLDRARDRLRQALVAGEEEVCRQIVVDLFLADHPLPQICDYVITPAFHDIGGLWECGEVEVYEERRACELCIRVIHELRQLVGDRCQNGPLALGGTLDGDPYTLAVTMAELILRDAGFNASSLGHLLPIRTVSAAIFRDRPRLVWLSISSIRDAGPFVREMLGLFETAQAHGTAVVLGGRALRGEVREQLRYSTYCDTFQHLSDFAQLLLSRKSQGESSS